MTHPIRDADESSLDALAQRWLREVAAAGYVPGRRAGPLREFRDLLEQLVSTVVTEPFVPEPGWRVGARLVELRLADPKVIGATVRLLAAGLPQLFDGDPELVGARVPRVLEQVNNGFAAALRDTAMAIGEDINRAMRVTWQADKSALHHRLQRARLHDPVTGLPNRAHLRETVRRLTAGGGYGRLGMCLLRVDGFADLNDALGHTHGDDLLAAIGRRLRDLVKSWNATARDQSTGPEADDRYLVNHLGGEQFVLVMTGTVNAHQMVKVAKLARLALRTVVLPSVDGYVPRVKTSAGIVEAPAGSRHEPNEWLRDAHRALAWAHEDPGGVVVFEQARAQEDISRYRLAAALPAALERGEFEPFFQPILALADRHVVALEAVARWRHPLEGLLGPARFIMLAEQTGLIRQLGHMLMEHACHDGAAWRAQGHDLLISVNLAAAQVADPSLVAAVADVLHRTRLPAEHLQLEITESAVGQGGQVLHDLAELGVRLALDDYGTGYAGLRSLSRLPVTTVKLAAELVADLEDGDDAAAAAIVRHTIGLCHDLNITVVADGITTEMQYLRLSRLGCDLGQGPLFAEPTTAGAVALPEEPFRH